jgi:hypothetical protein
VAHALHVDAAGRDIGGDEHAAGAVPEGGERPLPLRLGPVAVDRGRRDAGLFEPAHDLVGAVLGAGENQDALDLRVAQHALQERGLAARRHEHDALLDPLGGGGDRRDRDLRRVVQEVVREGRDGLRHGGREEQALPLPREQGHDALQRMDEAEVEHLVGLVEDEDLDVAQAQGAAVDEVEEPARGGDQDVDAAGELALLAADRHAPEDDGGGQTEVTPIGPEALGDLARELPGGAEHEDPAALADGSPGLFGQPVQDRQREGRRLAGPGLGDAAQVPAGHHLRDGLCLDGRRGLVALRGERPQDRLGEAEIGKRCQVFVFQLETRSRTPRPSLRRSWPAQGTARVMGPSDDGAIEEGGRTSADRQISVTQPRSSGSDRALTP